MEDFLLECWLSSQKIFKAYLLSGREFSIKEKVQHRGFSNRCNGSRSDSHKFSSRSSIEDYVQ